MPKTKKKVKSVKKVKKTAVSRPTVQTKPVQQGSFSPEFMNALLVIFGVGMIVFAYVVVKIYG